MSEDKEVVTLLPAETNYVLLDKLMNNNYPSMESLFMDLALHGTGYIRVTLKNGEFDVESFHITDP